MRRVARAERRQAQGSSFHPLEIGRIVSVIRLPANDSPFDEGLAVIKAVVPGDHRYRVRFIGDARVYVRFVHPAYQVDPRGTWTWLHELWRHEIEAAANPDDFFPPKI